MYSIVRKEFLAAGGVRYASYALMVCACCIMESDSYADVKAYAARDNYGYDVLSPDVGRFASFFDSEADAVMYAERNDIEIF